MSRLMVCRRACVAAAAVQGHGSVSAKVWQQQCMGMAALMSSLLLAPQTGDVYVNIHTLMSQWAKRRLVSGETSQHRELAPMINRHVDVHISDFFLDCELLYKAS
jgi:hypothetical protein